MKRSLLVLIGGPFIGSALLTPVIYSLLLYVVPELPWPFFRVYSRVAVLILAIMIFAFRRELELSRLTEYFVRSSETLRGRVSSLFLGAAVSFVSSLLFFPLVLTFGKIDWAGEGLQSLFKVFVLTIPLALLVALIEEAFFRVILFNRLKIKFSVALAATLVSVLYAVLHFVSPGKDFIYQSYSASAGFQYLSEVVVRIANPELIPAMFGLFLVGMTLSFAIHKTRSIYLTIGLHAGWVLAMKMNAATTVLTPGLEYAGAVGRRYYLVSTPFGWLSVLFALCIVAIIAKYRTVRSWIGGQ